MIILEGPDSSGKSTFVDECKKKGISITKPYYPKKNQLKYYLLSGPLYANKWLERYYPSEMIYPRIKKGRNQMETWNQYLIEASYAPFNPVLIYFRPPIDDILKNISKRGDYYISPEEIRSLVSEYDKFMKRSTFKVIEHDFNKNSVDETIESVKKYKGSVKTYRAKEPEDLYLCAGDCLSLNNIMFVGEEPSNESIGNGFIRPFISDKGSSAFFHECLYEAGLYNKTMPYFTNFFKFSSHEESALKYNSQVFLKELSDLKPRTIIALGNKVYDILSKLSENMDISLLKLEHPAYIKRFGSKDKKIDYIESIKKIIIY